MIKVVEILPDKFVKSAISLNSLGVCGLAWEYSDFINVVEYLVKHNYLILGGDVYSYNNGKVNSTYDSWYIEKDAVILNSELLQQSKIKAISYVDLYNKKNGDNYCYSIVIE